MKKTLFSVVIFLVLSVSLSACGQPTVSTNIEVSMVEFTFTPNEFTVPAGQEITIHVTNNGAAKHDFLIFKLGTNAGETFGPEDEPNIYWRTEVEPGQSVTDTFTAPSEPGEYFVTCGVQGHMQAGMIGKLFVVAQ